MRRPLEWHAGDPGRRLVQRRPGLPGGEPLQFRAGVPLQLGPAPDPSSFGRQSGNRAIRGSWQESRLARIPPLKKYARGQIDVIDRLHFNQPAPFAYPCMEKELTPTSLRV